MAIKADVKDVHLNAFPHEEDLLKPFLAVFDVTWGRRRRAQSTDLSVYLLKPHSHTQEAFGFEQELLLVYSPSTILVEFDGDDHYRDSLKIKADREKDRLARAAEMPVVRVPYRVQIDAVTLAHYFGLAADIRQDFPHGFITTKLFPASFCELGVERFRADLTGLPLTVTAAVIESLKSRIAEHGAEYVLPSTLRGLIEN